MTSSSPTAALQAHFRASASGEVPSPGSAEYLAATATMNTRIQHEPACVVIATTVEHVVGAVQVAAQKGLRVSVRSTGHGMWPVTPDTIIIDVSKLNAITVDPRRGTVTVGPGARWHDVLARVSTQGFGGLAGSSTTVGVVGFHLGGGLGPVSRTYGSSADYVVSLHVVTAAGDHILVSADENPELFWAMRGGGALGIVTSLTFALVPDAHLRAGGIYFAADEAPAVLHRWREWTEDLPNSLSTSVAIIDTPALEHIPEPIRGRRVLHVRYAEVAENPVDPPAVLSFGPSLWGGVDTMSYRALGEIHAEPTHAKPTVQHSALLKELPSTAIDRFLDACLDDSRALAVRELRLLGGAISEPQYGENAVAGRDAAFLLFALGNTPADSLGTISRRVDGVIADMEPWSTGATLASFAGRERARDRIDAAWSPQNLERLRLLRKQTDPSARFDPNLRWTRGTAL